VRLLLVVNSSASSVTARRRVLVARELAGAHDDVSVEVVETRRRGHATSLARAAARQGVDAVVVLGGDGTLNEVATALTGTDTALAPLPGGSTNVFARTLGLPEDPVTAATVTASSLAAGCIRSAGLGEVNGRAFTFHTGVGWDADLVSVVERHAELKRHAGHALFVWAGLESFLFRYDRRQPHFSVHFDDGTTVDDGFFTVVLNSDPYTFVGTRPFTVCPDATLDRGLAVVTLRSMELRRFLPVMADALRGDGGVRASRWVDVRTDVTSVVIRRRTTMPYQVDGDHLGEADELRFRHRPDAIRLVVPAGSDALAAA
jgi:diacylglycerol kinase family enzyme